MMNLFARSHIICSRCFERFVAQEALFRCTTIDCDGLEIDTIYAKMEGGLVTPIKMGKVLPAVNRHPLRGVMTSTTCSSCAKVTHKRICPHCHYDLPHDAGLIDQKIIAVIGGSTVGKSVYMVTLIHTLAHLNPGFHFARQFVGEESIMRWERDFRGPLYDEKKMPEFTRSSSLDKRVKTPLISRLYIGEAPQLHVMNMSFFDSAGEDMISFEKIDEGLKQVLCADGIIFLLDPLQIPDIRTRLSQLGQTQFPQLQAMANPEYIVGRLHQLFEQKLHLAPQAAITIPTAFTLSKIDRLIRLLSDDTLLTKPSNYQGSLTIWQINSISTEIEELLSGYQPGLVNIIKQQFTTSRYFGVSALGGSPRVDGTIDDIRPNRVEDPFLWLLHELGLIEGR